MWDVEVLGISVYNIISWLFIYSFIGWVWESIYVSIREKRVINRGFITGPLCTIYGIGAVTVYFILKPVSENLFLLFLLGIIVPTLLEYITAVVMEKLFHMSWWNYFDERYNYKGRVCLKSSLVWGIFTVVLFHVLHPLVMSFVNLYSEKIGEWVLSCLLILYIVDFTSALMAAAGIREKLSNWDDTLEEAYNYLRKTKLYEKAGELRNQAYEFKKKYAAGDYRTKMKNRLEIKRIFFDNPLSHISAGDYKKEFENSMSQYMDKLTSLELRKNPIYKRFINSYPGIHKVSDKRKSKIKKQNKKTD